jgi:hypothetical protein
LLHKAKEVPEMAIEEGCDAVVDLEVPLATSVGRPISNKKAKAALVMAASMRDLYQI